MFVKLSQVFILFFIIALAFSSCRAPLPVFPIGGEFTAQDHEGREFNLHQTSGKNKFLFFGYTHCPDFCPITLAKLSGVFAKIPNADDFLVLYMTVDPSRDTPERMAAYISKFKYPVKGLIASEENLSQIVQKYKAGYSKVKTNSELGYTVDHTTRVYLLDKENKVRHLFRYPDSVNDYLNVLKRL